MPFINLSRLETVSTGTGVAGGFLAELQPNRMERPPWMVAVLQGGRQAGPTQVWGSET